LDFKPFMSRILAIDYGIKRIGLAVTDPSNIIATPLTTVKTQDILPFLYSYIKKECVKTFVIGMPKRLNGTSSSTTIIVKKFIEVLKKAFPDQCILEWDERYTSKIASNSVAYIGMKKHNSLYKETIDMVSAALILQSFMETTRQKKS